MKGMNRRSFASGVGRGIGFTAICVIALMLVLSAYLSALLAVPLREVSSPDTSTPRESAADMPRVASVAVKVCSDFNPNGDVYQDILPIFALSLPPSQPPEYHVLYIFTIEKDEYPYPSLQHCAKWLSQDYFSSGGTNGGSLGAFARITVGSNYDVEGIDEPLEASEYWGFTGPSIHRYHDSGIPGERPSVALSVGGPQSAFLAFQMNRSSMDGGGSSIYFTMADDYWDDYQSWTAPREIVGANRGQPFLNDTPALAVDAADRVHVAYLRSSSDGRRDVYYLRNAERGDSGSWEAEPGRRLSWNLTDNHDMTIAASREGDTVVVLWTAANSIGNDDLAYAYSLDGGTTFSPALNLSATVFNEGYPAIFVDPDTSTFHVAYWRSDSNATRTNNILYTQASWASPQYWTDPLSVLDVGSVASFNFKRPAVVAYTYAGNHTVYVAWTDARNPLNLDIYMTNVTDVPVSCDAIANPTSGPAPLDVIFMGSTDKGRPPYTTLWSFGDGTTGIGPFWIHRYKLPGDYDAVFRVDDSLGTTCFDAVRIHVTYSLQLTPGRMLMSIPMVAANDSIESVLSSVAGCYDYVRWYDPLDSSDHWKSYAPGRPYNDLVRLDNTMGFWINITATCNFTAAGTRPVSTTIDLHQGWNMVGFPSFNTSYRLADLKADLGLAGVVVEVFDVNASPYYLKRTGDDYVMRAGEGYWVFVPSDVAWIVKS